MEEKLQQLIELTEKKKLIDEAIDVLKEELKPQIEKQEYNGYLIYKTTRSTYKLKKGVDEKELANKYPECLKIDTNKLYKIADNVDDIMEVSWSESITVKKEVEKESEPKAGLKEF